MVYEEGMDVSKFSDKQKAQIKLVEVVAAVTGVEIHLFESKLDQNGMYGVLSFYSKQGINGVFTQKPHIVLTIAERSFYQEGGRAGYNEIIENAIKEGRILDYDAKKEMTCQ